MDDDVKLKIDEIRNNVQFLVCSMTMLTLLIIVIFILFYFGDE